MRRRVNLLKSIDWITVLAFLLLISFGWINIYAAEYNEQHQSIFDISQRYGKQMIWILAAIIIASHWNSNTDHKFYGNIFVKHVFVENIDVYVANARTGC